MYTEAIKSDTRISMIFAKKTVPYIADNSSVWIYICLTEGRISEVWKLKNSLFGYLLLLFYIFLNRCTVSMAARATCQCQLTLRVKDSKAPPLAFQPWAWVKVSLVTQKLELVYRAWLTHSYNNITPGFLIRSYSRYWTIRGLSDKTPSRGTFQNQMALLSRCRVSHKGSPVSASISLLPHTI